MVGLVERAVQLGGDELAVLTAEIGPADVDELDPFPRGLPEDLEVLQGDLGLQAEHLLDVAAVQQVGHVPVLEPADAAGVFFPGPGKGRGVPEAAA